MAGAPPLARLVSEEARPFAVCLVCTGNICRSPMAEVVLTELARRHPVGATTLAERLRITSAGTGPWHVGEPMDRRARAALDARGYRDPGHVARQLDRQRLDHLDLVVALDRSHLVPGGVLLRSFEPSPEELDVPDPYYGDEAAFAECLAVIERSCEGLVQWLAHRLA